MYGSTSFVNTPDVNGTLVMLNGGGNAQISSGLYSAKPAAGTAGNLYVASDNKAIWEDTGAAWVPLSRVLNIYSSTIPLTSGAATLALSNTAPTSASGIQIATLTVTPISTSSKFLIHAAWSMTSSTAASTQTGMIFQGTTLLATTNVFSSAAAAQQNAAMNVIASPATAAAVTFTIRAGTTAGTLYINSNATFTTEFGSTGANNAFTIIEYQ